VTLDILSIYTVDDIMLLMMTLTMLWCRTVRSWCVADRQTQMAVRTLWRWRLTDKSTTCSFDVETPANSLSVHSDETNTYVLFSVWRGFHLTQNVRIARKKVRKKLNESNECKDSTGTQETLLTLLTQWPKRKDKSRSTTSVM